MPAFWPSIFTCAFCGNYDADGNLTSDGTGTGANSYQYDAEGRMIYWSSGGSWQSMMYNAFGQRMAETMPDGTDNRTLIFPRDMFGRRVGIFDDRPSLNWYGFDEFWLYVGDERLTMGGGDSDLRHENGISSTTMMTNQEGTASGDIVYGPWGNVLGGGGSNADVFAGLGFQINYPSPPSATRDYNPTLGRWLTPDPAGRMAADTANPQSWNMYAYVGDNPTSLNDPSGLTPLWGDPNCTQAGETTTESTTNDPGHIIVNENINDWFNCAGDGDVFTFGSTQGPSLLAPDTGFLFQNMEEAYVAAEAQTETCSGSARVLKGNAKLVGRPGGFSTPRHPVLVTAAGAAVIPSQWGGAELLRPSLSQVSGVFPEKSYSFSGIVDTIGSTTIGHVQAFLMHKYPSDLILELPGAPKDFWVTKVTLTVPSWLGCPEGTTGVH